MSNASVGYAFVLAAVAASSFGFVVGLVTGFLKMDKALPWVRRSVYATAAALIGSNLVMVWALLSHDFSVKYVAQVGSRSTPAHITIVSLWSALEGSILFWGFVMGAFLFAFAWIYRKEESRYMQFALAMMSGVAVFFAFLIAGPANPWVQLPIPPPDGPGPNPLLQNHVLMIVHPPMLYGGYVGMTIPFGIASGALLNGQISESWMAPLRKWTLVPWVFLTIGIILGSWWAYAVLGWGGYWAWDPVENASLLPWLTATAFMHSTMVLERRRMLKLWTLALALGTFTLTIIGTFMTRSGVFNSVHAFTQSSIGPTFLVFIAIVLVFSIALLALRGHLLVAESSLEQLVSREGSLLVNNLVFVAVTFTVFLGTSYPLVTEALFGKRISVGEPYFNKMALPGCLIILFLMGAGPMLPWGRPNKETLVKSLAMPSIVGLLTALVVALTLWGGPAAFVAELTDKQGRPVVMPLVCFALAAFVTVVTLRELFLPARARMSLNKESLAQAMMRSASRTPRRFGGYLVHLAIVIVAVGVAASTAFKVHTTGTLTVGEGTLALGKYAVRLDGFSSGSEPHRSWTGANVSIISPNGSIEALAGTEAPRMNFYERSNDPVGSPAVQTKILKDIYLSLLAFDPKTKSASFNAWIFPMVGWIWYSIPLFVVGTLITLWPRRRQTALDADPASSPPPAKPEVP